MKRLAAFPSLSFRRHGALRRRFITHSFCPGFLVLIAPVLALAFASAPVLASQSEEPAAKSLRDARDAALAGEYEKAVDAYESAAKDSSLAIAAACGRAEVDLLVGDYRAGITHLESVRSAGERSADWNAAIAALRAEVGEYDAAIQHNRAALERARGHFRARLQLGQLLELTGDIAGAVETYKWFNERMTSGTLPDRAEDMTDLGRGFLRYSVLARNPDVVRRTKHVLTEVYQEAYEFVDAAYWPARLAGAELLLEKHNSKEAVADFQRVLEQNTSVAAAHVGLGWAALEDWNFEECEKRAAEAMKACPPHVGARVLLASTRMIERRYDDAARLATEALETNPNSVEALSVLAAARLRAGEEPAYREAVARVEKINPRCALLHHTLAKWLSAGRQFTDAEAHFKKAIDFSPTWSEPRADLGQLYMETGEEALARRTLEQAFGLDSFNAHTHNLLQLLDQIDHFARLETDHFAVKFDESRDGPIAPYFGEALERVHRDICERFSTTPDKQTIIEIFPDHMGFSVRITGRPFIATVGACTGRVIAMQAPRGTPPFGHYNWATVLRHEFTHTVTLAATENRIPHWMTEGLAVHEEPQPRTWRTKQLLSDAVRHDRLFTLKTIDWGFMRPRRADDRELAYAQSEWMVEYIIERWGEPKIHEMLKGFKDRQTQAEVFEKVLGANEDEFSRAFSTYASKEVNTWGLPDVQVEDSEKLAKQLEAREDDAGLLARYAESLLMDGDVKKAEEIANRALKRDAKQTRALEVLGHILVGRMEAERDEAKRAGLVDDAEPIIRRLLEVDAKNADGIKYLGYIEQARLNWPAAIALLSRYKKMLPDDPASFRRLAGIYLVQGREDEALVELEELARRVEDEPAVPRRIGEIVLKRGKAPEAAKWFRQAIEIDPYDRPSHNGLGEAYLKSSDFMNARRSFDTACRLKPDEPDGWLGLARVAEATGDAEQASKYKERAKSLGGG
ncbi:tetratricopeptide repeat protein [Phycisphaerae bacterium RAS2]|nr:tetratricopeptide repeat protein [Phycisphaerae bacterium RAS2]